MTQHDYVVLADDVTIEDKIKFFNDLHEKVYDRFKLYNERPNTLSLRYADKLHSDCGEYALDILNVNDIVELRKQLFKLEFKG